MRWLILYLVAVAAAWLLVRNDIWRRFLVAGITAISGVLLVMFVLLDDPENADAPQERTASQLENVRQREQTRFSALRTTDIAVLSTRLTNPERTVFDSAGREIRQPDLFRWILDATLENRSTRHAATDIVLRIELFSCPVFFDIPQSDVTPATLTASCAKIGRRSIGLEGPALKPGERRSYQANLTFPNQTDPRNPRYWIAVQTVLAAQD